MTEDSRALVNGVKLVGEAVLPGASLLMEGKVVNGAVHGILGLGAKALLGPAGLVLVAADSFSKSTTDKYLWDHLADAMRPRRAQSEAVDAEETAGTEEAPPASAAAN